MKRIITKIFIVLALCFSVAAICSSCAGKSFSGAANAYFNAFKKFDYQKMYNLLTPGAQGRVDYDEFVEYHKKVYDTLKIQSVKITKTGSVDNQTSVSFEYTAEFTSSEYGTFIHEMTLEVCKKADFYLVAWTPANVVEGMNWNDRIFASETQGARGEIFDRAGRLVVKNDYAVTIYSEKAKIANVNAMATQVAQVLGLDITQTVHKFEKSYGDTGIWATVFKQDFSAEQEEAIKKIENVKIDKSSITPIRYYPYKEALSQTLGYATPVTEEDRVSEEYKYLPEGTRVGRSGLELAYDQYLQPKTGKRIYLLSDDSKTKTVLYEEEARDGYDLILTVDILLQKNITHYMNAEFKDDSTGTVNIVNPKTGAVVSLVSYPSYDANIYAFDKATNYGDLFENKDTPLLNRNISGLYPPGSIFKSIMALIGLETKTVTTSTIFPYEDEIQYYTNEKERWRPKGSNWSNYIVRQSFPNAGNKGRLDMNRGLIWSDNIYFGWLAMMVGKDDVISYAEKLGIGEAIPFDLSTKKTQLANSYATLNSQKLLADTGFGQGEMLFTPLQLCCTWSLYGNNGTIMQPYIVDKICSTNELGEHVVLQITEPKAYKQNVFPSSTVSTVLSILEKTAKSGTGKSGTLGLWDTMTFAAKTGTAQTSANETGEIGWYAGLVLSGGEQDAVLVSADMGDYKFALVKYIFTQLKYE